MKSIVNSYIYKIIMKEIKISVNKNIRNTNITISDSNFTVLNHWFWEKFNEKWEPKTLNFFKRNLEKGRDYLDIGAWVGPTSLIATALGAGKIKIIEPNPMNFFHLLATQVNNSLFSKWFLINACVSSNFGSEFIGPLKGIVNSSSATNIRDQNKNGAKVLSLKLSDLISDKDDFSLIKIDIEGAEAYIIDDISVFSKNSSAIWLSIHPPFFKNKNDFLKKLLANKSEYHFVDENNKIIDEDLLSTRILSEKKFPIWGTEWGNFFEIGLLPKKFFDISGNKIE